MSKALQALTPGESLVSSGLHGARAWAVYAVVETFFLVVVQRLASSPYTFNPPHPGFTVLLFVLYPAFGFFAAAIAGVVARTLATRLDALGSLPAPRVFGPLATATVIVAFTVNLVAVVGVGVTATLAVGLAALLLALVGAVASPHLAARVRWVANPWTAAALIVGLTWLSQEYLLGGARVLKGAVALAYTTLVVAAAASTTWAARNKFPAWWPQKWTTYGVLPLAAVLLIVGFAVEQRIIDAPDGNSAPAPGGSPNIILISLDTVRADRLSIYGGRAATPRLEKFLQQATLYRSAISASDFTLASHASLFTGLYPSRHGAHSVDLTGDRPLDARFSTLAERLAAGGYHTAAVVGNYGYLGPGMGLAQGFQYYDARAPVLFLGEARAIYLRSVARNLVALFTSPRLSDVRFRNADEINGSAFELLTRLGDSRRPLFLFVNYMDAHWPYMPPEPFASLHPGRMENFTTRRYLKLWREVSGLRRTVSLEERQHLESQYDGAITYLDQSVGNLMDRLSDLGLYDKSLIVITSDHGEAFGTRDFVGHGNSLDQDEVLVPLLVKFPESRNHAVVDATVSAADVFPTALEVAHQAAVPGIDAESLGDIGLARSVEVMSENYSNVALNRIHPRFRRSQRAIFSGSMKLVVSSDGSRQLYDLASDPAEWHNRLPAAPEAASALQTRMDEWLRRARFFDQQPTMPDNSTLEQLRSLGYIR